MWVKSRNGILGLIRLTTDLTRISMLVGVSADLRCISSCLRLPNRRELSSRRYLDFFLGKVGYFNLLLWWVNYFPPCIVLDPLSCGLVLMWSGCHLHIFNGLDWSQQCYFPSMPVRDFLLPFRVKCHRKKILLETWYEALVSANTSNNCISCRNFWWGDKSSQCLTKYQDKVDDPCSSQLPNTPYYQTALFP